MTIDYKKHECAKVSQIPSFLLLTFLSIVKVSDSIKTAMVTHKIERVQKYP